MFRALWPYVAKYRLRVALALALLLVAKLATIGVPLALKLIVDELSRPEGLAAAPVFLLLAYALLRFAGTLFNELRDLVFARVSQRAMADFHERAFQQLLRLSARFHAGRETGRLTREVERGIAGIGFLLGVGLFTIVPTMVEIIGVMAILVWNYDWKFTAVIAGTFIAYTTFTVLFTQRRAVHQRALNELDSQASGRLVDSLLNYEAVKTHGNEALEARRYAGLLGDWVDIGLRNQRALSALHIGQSAIIAVGVALVMILAGREVVAGNMTVGDLVLVNAYVIQICLPLNALGFVFRQAKDAMINAEKLFALLNEKPEVRDLPAAPPLKVQEADVELDRVSFGYEPGRRILSEVSLRIPSGRTVAVVGGSGSGKSTLARLLLRAYDADQGAVRIDGQDVRGVTQESLRRTVGMVPQDTVLFNESLAWNIGYGRPGASREEIIEAAKAARIHDFILGLPLGYDTVVGERGTKLSGGERQRISIARLLLRNPSILIFDEATSALDARAERAIQEELERIAQGKTTLVIAHRMSTIVNADEIVVLEHGRVVERGTHAELLARGDVYAQMWALQQQEQSLKQAEQQWAPRRRREDRDRQDAARYAPGPGA
jgi:ATP-binding cassette subfamily B protein